jgi:hypothetical protein
MLARSSAALGHLVVRCGLSYGLGLDFTDGM